MHYSKTINWSLANNLEIFHKGDNLEVVVCQCYKLTTRETRLDKKFPFIFILQKSQIETEPFTFTIHL